MYLFDEEIKTTYQVGYDRHSFFSKWLAKAKATRRFKNFIRNVDGWEGYDTNSFVGKWHDYYVWSDKEYWKLEQGLIELREAYPYPANIPRDVLYGVFRIMQVVTYISGWDDKYFNIEFSTKIYDEITVSDRYERLLLILESVYSGQRLEKIKTNYAPSYSARISLHKRKRKRRL